MSLIPSFRTFLGIRTRVRKILGLDRAEPARPQTDREIVEAATAGRRRPLRGRALVDLAIKLGLAWSPTGTGLKPGTLLCSRRGIRLNASMCRKCAVEASIPGRTHCRYCNNDFTARRIDPKYASEPGIRHLVMENGSIERVEIDEGGHVFKPAPKPTKKERNRLKREQRRSA